MAREQKNTKKSCEGPSCATGKGMMKWAWICCAGPLLLLLLLPAFGLSVGGVLGGSVGLLFPLLLILACPLGMYFMMRGMQRQMGEQQAEQGRQAQSASPQEPEVIEVTDYKVKPVGADSRQQRGIDGRES